MKNIRMFTVWSIAGAITALTLIVLICSLSGKKETFPHQSDKTETTVIIRFDIPAISGEDSAEEDFFPRETTGGLHIGINTSNIPDAPVIEDVIIIPGNRE